MLYFKALNAIYVIMKSELLFYKFVFVDITYIGFKLDPYSTCVEKNSINCKQITVVCKIDELKVSHNSKNIFNRMGKYSDRVLVSYEEQEF